MWLPDDFSELATRGDTAALELEHMLLTRHPEERFAAEDRRDLNAWVKFFGRMRKPDGRRKGVVEIEL